MNKNFFLLIVCVAVLAISLSIANATSDFSTAKNAITSLANKDFCQEKPAGQDTKVIYTCPMHPSVSSDKAGKCPTCGMDLVKKDVTAVSFTCPMHPEVKSDKAGKCSKCGMNLEKKTIKKDEPKK
jgi:hypothetical protein